MSFFIRTNVGNPLSRQRRSRRQLRCEPLEARRLLTSYLVDSLADTIADDGMLTLREAVLASNTNASVNEAAAGQSGLTAIDAITFASTLSGGSISLGLGELMISDSLQISLGAAQGLTIDAFAASRVLNVGDGVADFSLRGLTLSGGRADLGGGLLVGSAAHVTLFDVNVTGNVATGTGAAAGGGGIYNRGGELSILGGSIRNNIASGAGGSGGGLLSTSGNVVISETLIQSNIANRAGGGIEIIIGSVTLDDVVLGGRSAGQGNTAGPAGSAAPGNGGGLHVSGDAGATQTLITISGGEVLGNFAASEGGGLWNASGAAMTITGKTQILGNRAAGVSNTEGGGGIFNNGGLLIVTDAAIRNNAATGAAGGGGGIASDNGTVRIDNTFIEANFAAGAMGSGGGLLGIGTSRFTVVDSEIAGNVASRAGGGIEINTSASASQALTLLGVALTDNNAGVTDEDATASAPGNGGGLHVTGSANVLIIDSSVTENIAALEGGGLWNGAGTLRLENTLVSRNSASGNSADDGGGGVFNNGGLVIAQGGVISLNIADGISGSGGGLFNNGGRIQLNQTHVDANVASRAGGGVEAAGASSTSFIDVTLSNNTTGLTGPANPGNGGGLHISGAGSASFSGGVVRGNIAANEGGGLWNGSGTLTVTGTDIISNVASGPNVDDGGGGLFNNGGTVNITGSMISGNVANGPSGSGGGVLNALQGAVTITDSTVSGNISNRAGGGIEVSAGSVTTLNNVKLDSNNTGVNGVIGNPAASPTTPLLSYFFDGSGASVVATGSAAAVGNPRLLFTDNSGAPADLRGGPGSGVSGAASDRAFDNTFSSGIVTASGASNATDFNAIDALSAFTLSGWFRLPSTATESIGRQDALIENGTISASDQPGGYRLRGGPAANSGTLELRINRDRSIESSRAYTEIGEYVFFAVSYDGTKTTDNVKFYKGTVGGAVTLVDTLTLDAGPVLQENIPLSIGVTKTSGLTLNPFNGQLDEIRIDGAAVSIGELEARRFAITGLATSIVANPGNGGGLHISGDGIVRINGGTVTGNLAANEGGGLWNSASGQLIVDGTTISRNISVDGGGVYGDGGAVTLLSTTVSGNQATDSGGGIFTAPDAQPFFPLLQINDSVIDGNISGAMTAGSGGGGIFAAGSAVLTNTDVINNRATQGTADGGGVFIDTGADFSFTGGIVSGNRAARAGGGIENNMGFFSTDGTDFINNFSGVNGGAVHQSSFGFTVIAFGDVIDNQAANEGGGLWNSDGGFMSAIGVNFGNNSATFGGAIFGDGLGGDLSIDDSTFMGNSANVNGGAIATEGGTLFIATSLFNQNTAAGNAPGLGGGAIFTAAANQTATTDLINNNAGMPQGNGGGILFAAGVTGTYFGGTIQGNRAGRAGGGIEVIGQIFIDSDVISDTDLVIDGNVAGINGGGLHISGTGDVRINRSTVSSNEAVFEGGGLWNSAAGTLDVSNTNVTGNVAQGNDADQGGGGIYNDGGTVTVADSWITDNAANGTSGSGGGILNVGGTINVSSSFITTNRANRAGGGIEISGASISNLVDVNLDGNLAGIRPAAGPPRDSLLSYSFNDMGTSTVAAGTSADATGNPMLNFVGNNNQPTDLHGGPGSGVSGAANDIAFDNTGASNGLFGSSRAQNAADFDPIDGLSAFTLSGWFRLPSSATQSIGTQDALIENGNVSSSGAGAGYRLRAGASSNAGTLELRVNRDRSIESSRVYSEIGE